MRVASPPTHTRAGFTLVELLVVISVFVVLTVMTIGAIDLSATSQRVRGAARQVQSKIEGARDRAIYSSRNQPDNPRPVGIRLLVDENIKEFSPASGIERSTVCTSIAYVQSPGVESNGGVRLTLDAGRPALIVANDVTGDTAGVWTTLSDRGLVGPGSKIRVSRAGGSGEVALTLLPEPTVFPLSGGGPYLLHTAEQHPDTPSTGVSNLLTYSLELLPDVMAGEQVLELPQGTCIDLETSHLPDGWVTPGGRQFSNRMDILFSSSGTVVGSAAAAGIIHLHVVDIADALENALPGSPTLPRDIDNDGNDEYPVAEFPEPPARHGDELGITIFTKSGRTTTHPIGYHDLYLPADSSNADGQYYPPFGDLTAVPGAELDGTTGRGFWNSTANYNVDDVVAPTQYSGVIFRAVGTNSTAFANEPSWNLAPGGLTQGNEVIWLTLKHDVWELGLQGEVAR